jgi:MoaA/NifB/PqqE/SkfB family radical SAM enzyme
MNKIELNKPWKKVVWITTTVCNYSCSYCAPSLHNGKHRWLDNYSNVINLINKFRQNSPLVLDIMGGEPTLWPKFQDFCKEIKSNELTTSIQFTSNGSRTVRYWETFDAPVDTLGFSFHPEFAKEQHYIDILQVLHKRYNVKVFLMMPPTEYDRIRKFYYDILNSDLEIDVAVKLIKDNQHNGLIDGYTNQHKQFSTNRMWKSKVSIIDDSFPLLNGKKFIPQELVNTGKDNFKGWMCNVGIDRLSIEPNGDVYGSTCYITKPYGNINTDKDIDLPILPTLCTKNRCGCGADISISKEYSNSSTINTLRSVQSYNI